MGHSPCFHLPGLLENRGGFSRTLSAGSWALSLEMVLYPRFCGTLPPPPASIKMCLETKCTPHPPTQSWRGRGRREGEGRAQPVPPEVARWRAPT